MIGHNMIAKGFHYKTILFILILLSERFLKYVSSPPGLCRAYLHNSIKLKNDSMSGIKKDGFQFLRAMIDYIAMAVLSIAMEFSLYFVRGSRFTIHSETTDDQF